MGTFQQFLSEKQITTGTLLRLSRQLEVHSSDDRALSRKRAGKRRDKETQGKSYAELELGKPRSGRGVSAQQVQAALGDQPLPPRVRGKLVRAVNAVLTKAGGGAVDAKALFGDVPARKGTEQKKAAS
jgi:hypothetical protein